MNDRLLTTVERKSRNNFEEKYRKLRRAAQKGLSTAVDTLENLLNLEKPDDTSVSDFLSQIGKPTIEKAISDCKALDALNRHGLIREVENRYSNLRRYTPAFFQLSFAATHGNEALLRSIELLRELNSGQRKTLPDDVPTKFMLAPWKRLLYDEDGKLSHSRWELGLYFTAKQALNSGALYLVDSRRHRDLWEMMYSNQEWPLQRAKAYSTLQLPNQFDQVLHKLRDEFEQSITLAQSDMEQNGFATIIDGNLKLRKDDKLPLFASTEQLREQLSARMPLVRIEQLLAKTDELSNFSSHFTSLPGLVERAPIPLTHLHASLIAHGTNLGLFGMGHSNESVSVDQLRHASQRLIREPCLDAANAALIATHRTYPICSVWGDGSRSSSDGQRFGIQRRSLLRSFYPRYFGYYDRAITVYTHTSDQFSVFNTLVIACSTREATYVLDGLLNNITEIQPQFHSTDTHGFTEHLFGLCYLLGISFQPRFADIPNQRLYKLDKQDHYGDFEVLFHAAADIALIREQWDQLVRIAASLKNRIAPSHIILERLAGRSPSDRAAKALAALGRIVKSTYILRYLSDPDLRYAVQLQLNRGEARHQLAKHLFFINHGIFKTNDLEQIINKASCLSLLSNAVLVWNTHHMAQTVSELRRLGYSVDYVDLARISPLSFRDILVNGTYDFSTTGDRNIIRTIR